jgi:hypothetical protein
MKKYISIHRNIFSFYYKNKKMRSKMETELFRKIFSLGKLIKLNILNYLKK